MFKVKSRSLSNSSLRELATKVRDSSTIEVDIEETGEVTTVEAIAVATEETIEVTSEAVKEALSEEAAEATMIETTRELKELRAVSMLKASTHNTLFIEVLPEVAT